MNGPKIEIRSLSLSYGRCEALAALDLEVAAGESLGLIGPNGAGKTSLVGCVLGLLRPSQGSVRIDGRRPDGLEIRRELGYVPERCSVDPGLSARSTLRLHHALSGRGRRRREDEISALLERLGLEGRDRAPVRTFSKGMLQRLAFGIALVGRPRLLVLDEPFSGVDPAGLAVLRELVQEFRARGATLLLNSHRLDQVARLCDRVALLAEGRLRAVAPAGQGDEALERLVVAAAAGAGP